MIRRLHLHAIDGASDPSIRDPKEPLSHSQRIIGPWIAYAAALWAAVFAVFHIVWAAGWYPLLDAEQTRIAFATPWKWWFDVVVAAMCVMAVPVALAPVTSWGQRLPRRPIYVVACIGSALLVLRATASLAQIGYFIAVGRFRLAMLGVWEPWFYLGATLFALSTWRSRPQSRVSQTNEELAPTG